MDERLYLNGYLIDLQGTSLTRQIQIASVQEVGERKSSFSYTINIPETSKNRAFLDMLGTIGNTSSKPYEKLTANYYVEGIILIENGFAIVKGTSKGYALNIVDGIKSLSNLLAGKKIADLDLSSLDHILNTSNYIGYLDNTEGFIYGIADYGKGVASDIKVESQAPSLFVHTLFSTIFQEAGVDLEGDFFTTNQDYLTEVVAPSRGYDITQQSLTTSDKGEAESDLIDGDDLSDFPNFDDTLFEFTDTSLVDINIVSGDLEFENTGLYRIELTSDYFVGAGQVEQIIEINSIEVSSDDLEIGIGILNFTKELNIVANDIVSVRIKAKGLFDSGISKYEYDYFIETDLQIYQLTGGQAITASDYIADIDQLDLIKDVINRHGLVIRPSRNKSAYEFKRIDSILLDKANAEDWTSRLSLIKNESYNSGYSQINKAKYNYPKEIVIPNMDGEMLITNENANIEKIMFNSIFEIANKSVLVDSNQTYLIPIWELKDEEIENVQTTIKVFKIDRINTIINAKLLDESSGVVKDGNIPFCNYSDMSMQYFLNTNYSEFKKLIESFVEHNLIIDLSEIDIYQLDFFKLKYLKQFGRYFYLVSVQHKAGELSSVKMLELN